MTTPSWSDPRTSSLCRRTNFLRNSSSTSNTSNRPLRRISNVFLQNSAHAALFVFTPTMSSSENHDFKFCPRSLAQFLSSAQKNGRSPSRFSNTPLQVQTVNLKMRPPRKRTSRERATHISHPDHRRQLVWLPTNLRCIQPHAHKRSVWQREVRAPRPHPIRHAG